MKSKNIVFLDVDGTLCLDDMTMPSNARLACERALANGHMIYLCTGRSVAELDEEILSINFSGIIGAGGGYCESDGKVVFHKQVTPQQVRHAVDYFNQNGINFYLESNGGLYASKHCVKQLESLIYGDMTLEAIAKRKKETGEHSFIKLLIKGAELYREDINKICFLGNDSVPFEEIKKEFSGEYEVIHCTVPMFGENSGELGVVGVHKANAIEALLAYLNLENENTIAIGDGWNDIEMFDYCNQSIAMGNADDRVKAMADDVGPRHDEDGLYQIFKNYQLI